jgi:hypothetical protein
MTDDEKRALKGQLLLEINETEDHLSALRAEASHHGQLLEYLGKALLGNPSNALKPFASGSKESALSIAREALSHDDLHALVKEYESTLARLVELNAKKRALGIADRPGTT